MLNFSQFCSVLLIIPNGSFVYCVLRLRRGKQYTRKLRSKFYGETTTHIIHRMLIYVNEKKSSRQRLAAEHLMKAYICCIFQQSRRSFPCDVDISRHFFSELSGRLLSELGLSHDEIKPLAVSLGFKRRPVF